MAGALVSVVCTMGLLIGLGFDVHIMSSMIAIFLMPIAVVDSVHILSEFFDAYQKYHDKGKTIRHVVDHLFMPMLYTSLTTVAGFASLGTTPIPPVRVFGLHVAFGVALAWLLTITFIPAFIMIFVSKKSLEDFGSRHHHEGEEHQGLMRALTKVGRFTYLQWKLILLVGAIVIGVSAFGISRIRINDNPVKWFTESHPIRVADTVLNNHFGGTYTAYLTLTPEQSNALTCREKAAHMSQAADARFGQALPEANKRFQDALRQIEAKFERVGTSNEQKCFVELVQKAEAIDQDVSSGWLTLADTVNYLDPEGLTYDRVVKAVDALDKVDGGTRETFKQRLAAHRDLAGGDLQDQALAITDAFTKLSFADFVYTMQANLTAPAFKQPAVLRWMKELQDSLLAHGVVGKTTGATDALEKANYELNYQEIPEDATEDEKAALEARNQSFFSIPDTPSGCAQVYIQLEGMKRKDALFHLVTRDYQEANLWVQLTSGDNTDMETVAADVASFMEENPPPIPLKAEWAGLTYLNVVWQDKMVSGMLWSLGSSFIVVLVMMVVLFRSFTFGLLSMIPLSVTIAFIYGLIGLMGKDYDMPVAVLSSLTLGLSIDFAIHFLERSREVVAQCNGDWGKASGIMFAEPATAISRNAIVIAIGFLPLLVAPLVPYKTVGFFLATIMAVSGVGTLLLLPALVTALQKWLFKAETDSETQPKES